MKHLYYLFIFMVIASCDYKETIKLNEIKVIGSHNSYKIAYEKPLFELIKEVDSVRVSKLHYGHIPIIDQLDLGLRNLEIDIFHDPKGGRFSNPKGLKWIERSGAEPLPFDQEKKLSKPGFKVFHIQDFDFRSHELLFSDLLLDLKLWSDSNPDHIPVFITLEAKDKYIDSLVTPLKFSLPALDSIDSEIIKHLGREKLITPDLVMGNSNSINEQITSVGWPELEKMKGRFFFVLDDYKEKFELYIKNHPGLKGRVMFANAKENTPEAAFMIINDPEKDRDYIKQMITKGYMIRTRADASTRHARNNDYSRFNAALESGAQVISTDYYIPSGLFPSTFKVIFEDQSYVKFPKK